MPGEFDFISPTDKPALLAISNPEWMGLANMVASELGYKAHSVNTHEEFLTRFNQVQYQLLILEEVFACASLQENVSLLTLQGMHMAQRRHTVVVLLGSSFQTLNTLQAFQFSVHVVVN